MRFERKIILISLPKTKSWSNLNLPRPKRSPRLLLATSRRFADCFTPSAFRTSYRVCRVAQYTSRTTHHDYGTLFTMTWFTEYLRHMVRYIARQKLVIFSWHHPPINLSISATASFIPTRQARAIIE